MQTPLEISNPPDYIQVLQDTNLEIDESPPSTEEICQAVNQLNDGKASLDIPPELLKLASNIPNFRHILESYFNKKSNTRVLTD